PHFALHSNVDRQCMPNDDRWHTSLVLNPELLQEFYNPVFLHSRKAEKQDRYLLWSLQSLLSTNSELSPLNIHFEFHIVLRHFLKHTKIHPYNFALQNRLQSPIYFHQTRDNYLFLCSIPYLL